MSRRGLLAGIGGGAVAGSLFGGRPSTADAAGPSPHADDTSRNLLEFAGKMIQEGGRFTGFGYVTFLRGIDPRFLFFGGGAPSESAALLTVHAVATLQSIARVNGVFVAHAAGVFRLYHRATPGADFADPSSFAVGSLVLDDDAEYQNTLSVIAPNEGMAHVVAALTRRKAPHFDLGGVHCRIGHRAARSRLTAVGKGLRTDELLPVATFDLGGFITATDS